MSNITLSPDARRPARRSSDFVQQTFEFEADPESRPNDAVCDEVRRDAPASAPEPDPLVDATERCAFWSILVDVVKNRRR